MFGESSSYRPTVKSSSHVTGFVEIHLGQGVGIEHKYALPSVEHVRFSLNMGIGIAGPSVQINRQPPMFGESSSYRAAVNSSSHVIGLVEIHLGQVLGIEHKYTLPSVEHLRFSLTIGIGIAAPSVQNNRQPPMVGESRSYRAAVNLSSHVTGLVEIHAESTCGTGGRF
jgi:hypothetical protein